MHVFVLHGLNISLLNYNNHQPTNESLDSLVSNFILTIYFTTKQNY